MPAPSALQTPLCPLYAPAYPGLRHQVKHKTQLAAIGHIRQRRFQRAPCRVAASPVAVVTADDLIGRPEQQLNVVGGRRGAQRGHGIINAVLRQRDDVHIAFDHQQTLRFGVILLRFIQAVQLAAFMENIGLREFRYFGSASPSTRPPKPITRPRLSRIGNITRSRKRS